MSSEGSSHLLVGGDGDSQRVTSERLAKNVGKVDNDGLGVANVSLLSAASSVEPCTSDNTVGGWGSASSDGGEGRNAILGNGGGNHSDLLSRGESLEASLGGIDGDQKVGLGSLEEVDLRESRAIDGGRKRGGAKEVRNKLGDGRISEFVVIERSSYVVEVERAIGLVLRSNQNITTSSLEERALRNRGDAANREDA